MSAKLFLIADEKSGLGINSKLKIFLSKQCMISKNIY